MKHRRTWSGESQCETAKKQRSGREYFDSDGPSIPYDTAMMPSIHHSPGSFIHEPLKDCQSEIRLLQMLPGDDNNEDCLKFSIRTEDFHQVPKFTAISYTWGIETSPGSILIDTKGYPVRQNCRYVLKQTYRHWKRRMLPSDLLWIDSVCINQEDLTEKASQVSIMGEIYSKAELVLAGVGPHANDSEFFVEKSWEVADLKYDYPEEELLSQDCRLPWEEWAKNLGIESLSRLCRACETFGEREYWTRVWIIQEIAKATSLQILCGNDIVPWRAIHNLEDFLGMVMDETESLFDKYEQLPTVESNQMHDVFIAKKTGVPIDEVFSQFARFSCTNPRDHLYGLLSLIEMPHHAKPIFPNYGESVLHLAMQVEPHLAFEQIPQMLAVFRITSKDEHVQRLIGQRREAKRSENPNSPVSAFREFKPISVDDQETIGTGTLCGWIKLDESGQMTSTLVKTVSKMFRMPLSPSDSVSENLSQGTSDWEETKDFENDMASFLPSTSSAWTPQALMSSSEVAGFVCHDAREGDILVPLPEREGEVYLVLRQNHKEIYDIVGQGIFRPGYQFGCEPGAVNDLAEVVLFKAQIELRIGAEDAVLLFAQDKLDLGIDDLRMSGSDSDSGHTCNQEGLYRRVFTSVGRMLSGAARVTMQTPMLAKDVTRRIEDFDPHRAHLMREMVRDRCSSVVGQHSTVVVSRVPGASDGWPELFTSETANTKEQRWIQNWTGSIFRLPLS